MRAFIAVLACLPVAGASGARAAASGDSPLDDPRTAARVSVQAAVSTEPIVPGEPFFVTVRVTPLEGLHVYAPGSEGYTTVALTLDWPRDVTPGTPRYPPGEPFIFGDLKELVQVYSGPFSITQRATLRPRSAAVRAGRLRLTGTLRFQACTDRLCYPPESVPVEIEAAAAERGKKWTK